MAKSVDDVIRAELGNLVFQLCLLDAQHQKTQEELDQAKAEIAELKQAGDNVRNPDSHPTHQVAQAIQPGQPIQPAQSIPEFYGKGTLKEVK